MFFLKQILGTTDFAVVHMGLIVSDCVHEIEKNDTMFITQSENNITIAEDILHKLCPNDCMQQGNCVDGMTTDS